jgi:hypothetical protein
MDLHCNAQDRRQDQQLGQFLLKTFFLAQIKTQRRGGMVIAVSWLIRLPNWQEATGLAQATQTKSGSQKVKEITMQWSKLPKINQPVVKQMEWNGTERMNKSCRFLFPFF